MAFAYTDIPKKLKELEEELHQQILQPSNRSEGFMQVDLMTRILQLNPSGRLSIQEILNHILFWQEEQRYTYICDISEMLNALEPENIPQNARALNKYKKVYKDGKHKGIEKKQTAIRKLKMALDYHTIDVIQLTQICQVYEFEGLKDDASFTEFIKKFRNKV